MYRELFLLIAIISIILLIILIFNSKMKNIKKSSINKLNIKKELSLSKIIIIFFVIIVLLGATIASGYYIFDQSYNDLLNEKKSVKNEFLNTQNKLNNSNSQLAEFEAELFQYEKNLQENYSELQNLTSGDKYHLHDPLWDEIIEFSSSNQDFDIIEIINNLKDEGIKCAYVYIQTEIRIFELIGINTLDYGMLYIEPGTYYLVYPEIDRGYYDCVIDLPYGPSEPEDNDIIERIMVIW